MWNVNSLVQDLNSDHCDRFLHHERLHVEKVSHHFDYLENQLCGLYVIQQTVKEGLTVHAWSL